MWYGMKHIENSMNKRKVNKAIQVALVEDDPNLRANLTAMLNGSTGFQCQATYPDGKAALRGIPANRPDVVLMDINLPGLSGIEGVRRLKPQLPGTQFVMLTVYEDADHIFAALQAGACGYLLKQTPRLELLESLKDVYNGGSPMTSNIARKVVQAFQRHEPAPAPEQPGSDTLSPREREVLELLARGYLYKEIVDVLKISRPTVNTYIRRIYEKLHVRSRSQAVARFSRFSLDRIG